ncbi:MAG: bifunctional biotin--[acetyl-CoA-carboxylase] ligase/biotin operon repressor BirA [Arsenophonus sp. ER-BJ3-MAG3]
MKDEIILLKLIRILSDGTIYSDKQLSELLSIKRVYINKYIYILHKFGIEVNTTIHNSTSYQFSKKMDLLNYEQIYSLVKEGKIIIKPIINSTNQYLLECIDQLNSGDVCIAEYQTAGRGRRGRYWFSPFGCNLYLSLYWYLEQGPDSVMGLSLVIAIVIAENLNKINGSNIKVKWPNDLYLNGKKLAGILIEMIVKNEKETNIVIGIGLNIAMNYNYKTYNINQKWINLEYVDIKIERNIIVSQIILALRRELVKFEKYGIAPFINRWLTLDIFLNKKVKLHIGNHFQVGIVKGINEQGAILLEQNGETISYMDGEISLLQG